LLFQLIHVAHGHVKVVLKTSLHEQIIKLRDRVVQVVYVCHHVLVVLLEQLSVPANTDQLLDKRLSQEEILGCVAQLDQATVDLGLDLKTENSDAIVEHLVWRLGQLSKLVTTELIELALNLHVH